MELLIDNTAIHSVGRAIAGTAAGRTEFSDLLQFANQLLFADKLEVSTFEYDPIRKRTDSIRRRLRGLGVSSDILSGKGYRSSTYSAICAKAAQRLGADFDLIFPLYEGHSSRGRLWPEFTGKLRDHLELFYSLVLHAAHTDAPEIRDPSLPEKTTSAFSYTLALDGILLEKTQRYFRGKSEESVGRLVTVIRQYINEEMALHRESSYAPASSRRQLIAEHSEQMSTGIGTEVYDKLRDVFEVPCLSPVLALKAKGEPVAFIEETIRLRHEISEFRYALQTGNSIERADAIRFLRTLDGSTSAPRWYDAFQLHGFLPFITADISKLDNSWRHYSLTRRYRCLATLAVENQSISAAQALMKMQKNCRRKAQQGKSSVRGKPGR